jgi:hypothetical protein
MRKFGSSLVASLFGQSAPCNILNCAKTFESAILMTGHASKDPHPLYPAIWHSQPYLVLGIVETSSHQFLIVSEQRKVVGVNTLAKPIKGRIGIRFKFEDPMQLL